MSNFQMRGKITNFPLNIYPSNLEVQQEPSTKKESDWEQQRGIIFFDAIS